MGGETMNVILGPMNNGLRETVSETGFATSNTAHRTPARSLLCEVVEGASQGQCIAIGMRPIVVGADEQCDLVLEDPKVSSRHVEFRIVESGLQITDLQSRNGTLVNGARISEAIYPNAPRVRLGDTTIRVLPNIQPTLPPSDRDRFGGLVGDSLLIREVFSVLELTAPTDATVLIEGESGTGKELVARALHDHSNRASSPFVVLDCSAMNEDLIESQIFGHRAGAFTGAMADRKGAFASADGGTLFLDEIGELPASCQAKLLRALEDHTITPVGCDTPVTVNTRVVAATHRDLNAMVSAERFRFDLFHRLAVVHIALPPLRYRLDDLPALIKKFYEGSGFEPGPIDGKNLERLRSHNWPGNVRELRNLLERSWVLSGSQDKAFESLALWLGTQALPPFDVVDVHLPFKEAKERWVVSFERRYLAAVFKQNGGNITRAATHAGINRGHLRKLLDAHGLREKE